MGLFSSSKKSGGVLNVIRCDEPEYLVWKWRPAGQDANTTTRENAIRFGSSLRVKDGELAVFVYKQKDGTMQDYITGPFDDVIKTANFPVLSNIIGLAYGGDTPFQAEVYFINLAGNVQVKFGIPWFDVADPRFLDYVVPVSAGGTITFNITDYEAFIKLNRLINFTLEDFKKQIGDAVKRRVKGVIANAPSDYGFPQLPGQTIRGCGQNEIAATDYFLTLDGKVSGPFDSDELKKIARNGILNMDVQAWCQGMSAWVKASDIPELNKIITLSGV